MKIPDANLLLFAYDSKAVLHAPALSWLEQAFSGREPVGIPWQNIHAFLRIATNPRISDAALSVDTAIGIVQTWLEVPQVRTLAPGPRHWEWLQRMLMDGQARGPLTTDAQLAALTMEHGGTLYTNDRDFARFPGLRWVNPLAS